MPRPVVLFIIAAFFEIGGAWLVWQGIREHRNLIWVGAGVVSLGIYGLVAAAQPEAHFGRAPSVAIIMYAPRES